MTKTELIEQLEPFDDEIQIVFSDLEGSLCGFDDGQYLLQPSGEGIFILHEPIFTRP